jgi:hypothetical protein
LVNYCVIFGPSELVRRGIPTDKQANVLVHELFSTPSGEIYGYQGDLKTARKIRDVLRRRYGARGRLHLLSDEELAKYYPQTWML